MHNSIGNRNGVYLSGFILVIAGIFLLLSNLNIIDYGFHDIIFSWEVILIIIGLIIFVTSWDTSGLILILVGSIFLLAEKYDFNPWQLWPLVFIFIGLRLLFKPKRFQHKPYKIKDTHGRKWIERHENVINHELTFADVKEMYFSTNFQGGKINAAFSGIKIDLTNAKLAEGENFLDLSLNLSGIVLIVPREWRIIVQVSQILGGVSDKRKNSYNIEEGKSLVIRGSAVLGGCEIKSY